MGNKYSQPTEQLTASETTTIAQLEEENYSSSASIRRNGEENTVMGNLLSNGEEQVLEEQLDGEGNDVNNNVAVEPIQVDDNDHQNSQLPSAEHDVNNNNIGNAAVEAIQLDSNDQQNLQLSSAGAPPIEKETSINNEVTEDDRGTNDGNASAAVAVGGGSSVSPVRLDEALVQNEERLPASSTSTIQRGNISDEKSIVAKSSSRSQEQQNQSAKEANVLRNPSTDEREDKITKIQETSKISPPVESTGITYSTTLQQVDGGTSKVTIPNMEIEETSPPTTNQEYVENGSSKPQTFQYSDTNTSPQELEIDVIVPTTMDENMGYNKHETDQMEVDSLPIQKLAQDVDTSRSADASCQHRSTTADRVPVESNNCIGDDIERTAILNTFPKHATDIPAPSEPTQEDALMIQQEGTKQLPCIPAAQGGAAKGDGISEGGDFCSGTEDITLKSLPLNVEVKGDSMRAPRRIEAVREALDNIASCSICTGGVAPRLPFNLGIFVEGVGHLSLPLPDDQARILSSVGTQTPNGQNHRSGSGAFLVDKSRLHIRNPKWTSCLEDLVTKAVKALGVPRRHDITCKLSNLTLQRERRAHLKSNKSGCGHFATLVIQLPSTFAGGQWIVGHGRKSQLLEIDDDAEFRCHYCMFHADCDVDFDWNFTGHRLSLVYSLHYEWGDNNRNSIPSAESILAKQGEFSSLVRSLPRVEQVFLVPLNGKYTSSSLARYGINAFGDEDKKKTRAIMSATMGTWNLAVVECSKTEQKHGVARVEEGQKHRASQSAPSLAKEGFSADGHQILLPWINDVVDFSSCQASGMVVADEDTLGTSWGESFGSGHGVGSSRSAFCEMRLLLAWSDEGIMEVLCRSNLNAAVQLASTSISLKGAQIVLDFMLQRKRTLSWGMFCKLGEQFLSLSNAESRQAGIISLFNAIPTKSLPSPGSTNFIQSVLSKCEIVKPELLERIKKRVLVPSDHYDSVLSFVRRYEVAMALQEEYVATAATKSVNLEMLEIYAACKPGSIVGDCDDSTYPVYARLMKQAILRLTSRYSWDHIKNALSAAVDGFLDARDRSLDDFCGKIGLIQAVARITKNEEVVVWLTTCSKNVANELANPMFVTDGPGSNKSAALFEHKHFGACLEVLLEFGKVYQFDRLAAWSSFGKLENVERLATYLRKQASDSQNLVSQASKEGIEKICGEFKKRKVENLLAEKSKLEVLTQFGAPPFSWSIKPSNGSLPDTIQQFLGRNEPGPLAYTHWQGIGYSRGLARCSGPGYLIQAANFAVVIVKKTGEHHTLSMERYEQRMSRLQTLEEEIVGLVGPRPIGANRLLQAPDFLLKGKENISAREVITEYSVPFYPGKLGLVVEQEVASLGFKVIRLLEDGQAKRCGKIERGDFLTKIDGKHIVSLSALRSDKNGMRQFVFSRLQNSTAPESDNTGVSTGTKRDPVVTHTGLDHPSKKPRLGN